MASGDGLLVRVKPPAARLAPAQARALADATARFGNGVIELTQRGNLQVRGLAPATVAPFAAAMVRAGLAHPDPARESRRAVMPPPLLHDDPGLAPGAAAFTAALESAFATDPRLDALPPKFALAIDAGGILGGRPLAASLVAWTDGADHGLRLPAPASASASALAPVGLLPYPGTADAAFGLAPLFGQMDPPLLLAAADLAERLGAALRITPWRTLLLGRIPRDRAPRLDPARWIADPADPRLRITACPGAPACTAGEAPARADAARLRLAPGAAAVHISGCAKGCAHPGPAATVLVGRAGRYDLVRNGRAADPPLARDLTFEQAAALL